MPHLTLSTPAARYPEVGDIIHELNNALAPIILSVELLRRRTADPDAQRQLDLMAGHAWRGAAVARRILAWSEGRSQAIGYSKKKTPRRRK
jgi:signal transduction histidine kinase